jgi:hypothetical protein
MSGGESVALLRRTNVNEAVAKKVSANLGVRWPPAYWAAFRAPGQSAGHRTVMLWTKDEIVFGHKRLPIVGARATVDTSGNTAVAQGWLVKERTDARQLFLTVEGAGDGFVVRLLPDAEAVARAVATRINTEGGGRNGGPATRSGTASDIPGQIRELAELRDQGILTSSEFDTKKAELLAKM